MSLIEEAYRAHYSGLSGQERVTRALSLFDAICSMIRRRILAENPTLSERAVRKKIAEALYRTDPNTQRLLSLIE